MARPELDNLASTGALQREPPSRVEFEGLVRSAERRLDDARNADISDEGRFDLAYNAAHALALAALRWHGFRPRSRYVAFQALPHTLGVETSTWRLLSKCHDVRNRTEYGGAPAAEEKLLEELVAATGMLLAKVRTLPTPDG